MAIEVVAVALHCKMGDPIRKSMLIALANFASAENGGRIFPSVATLARIAECSGRTVQRTLSLFCAVGLLQRVKSGGSGPGSTASYIMNLGVLDDIRAKGFAEVAGGLSASDEDGGAAEAGEACHAESAYDGADFPSDEVSRGPGNKGDTVSPLAKRVTPATNKGDTGDTQPVKNNHQESERESASERGQENSLDGEPCVARGAGLGEGSRAEGEAQPTIATLDQFRKVWPNVAADDQTKLANAWAELPFAMRRAAVDGVGAFLAELKASGRKYAPASWKYIVDRKWTLVETQAAERRAETGVVEIKPWSRDWWALMLRKLAAGERCGLMAQWAAQGRAMTIRAKDAPTSAEAEALTPFECEGPEIAAWRGWFRARGVELPPFKGSYRVFLPSPLPPGAAAAHVGGF